MALIAHISDPHVGKSDAEFARFEKWLRLLESRPFDVLAVSGDLVDRADETSLRWVRDRLDSFSRPSVVVPGNHDVLVPGHDELFCRYFGAFPRVERHADVTFALFDSFNRLPVERRNDTDLEMKARTGFYADGEVGAAQLDAVSDALSEDDVVRVAVVHHFLFEEPNKYDLRPLQDAEAFLRWCDEHRVSYALVGHLHRPALPKVVGGLTRTRPGRCTKAPFQGALIDTTTGEIEDICLGEPAGPLN